MLSLSCTNSLFTLQCALHLFIFSLLCSHYVADLIKKLELHLMVVSVLLKGMLQPIFSVDINAHSDRK